MTAAPLPVVSSAEIVRRLEDARRAVGAAPRVVCAFDGDGTLWSGDVGCDLFEALIARADVRDDAVPALRAEAEAHALAASGDGATVARRLWDAYLAERYPEDRVFAMMAWVFAGWTAAEAGSFAVEVLRGAGFDSRRHRELDPVLAWAASAGVEAWVVSASPRAIVEPAAAALGIPAPRVVAMTPAVEGGRIAARLDGPIVYGPGKVVALAAAAGPAPVVGAFGDSSYDAAMLRAARVGVAVRPKAGLLAVAGDVPALVTVEPA